ncbi:MAG TPA: DUF3025 domain-containing protein, partial [Limnobacter sp.]|nr:DUF3025 domain-containing protein [Limnobacter sp.]
MPECPWLSALDVQCAIDFAGHAPGYVAERLNAMPHRGRLVGLPVFEPPQATLSALEYERCVASGAVPTRDLLHDWYNGVVWLACPKSKSFINQSHLRHAPLSGSSTAGNG